MKLTLQRLQNYSDYSIGALFINGELECFILEDEKRNVKIKSETRISAGVYNIDFQTSGTMHKRYSEKFSYHQGMIHLRNVPNFDGIFIHIGNSDDDTAGCLLVGLQHFIGKNSILSSALAYEQLYKTLLQAKNKNENIYIQIVDEFLWI